MNINELNIGNFIAKEKHDIYALEVIKEAILATNEGNFGIGAVLVDKETGNIIMKGHNNVFSKSRSDLHAEMSLITKFEDKFGEKSRLLLQKSILFTSLEPCPMCLCRIITAGIPEVYYVAGDETGGMVHLYDNLPSVWKEISDGRIYKKADCSETLERVAWEIFLSTQKLNDNL